MKRNFIELELRRIAKENGGICSPEEVVRQAKNQRSPLHNLFEWDDTKAGHSFRLWQARKLLVYVEYKPMEEKPPISVFVSLSSDRKKSGGYRLREDVMKDAEYRSILLEDALREMKLFEEKYFLLKELEELFGAMTVVRKKLEKKVLKVENK